MNFLQNKNLHENNNITKTGYRALFLLLQLVKQPLSRNELIEILEQDPIIAKDLSKDSITNTINTLRKSGCIISRPSQKTNNKYVLKSHPFGINFNKQQIDALQIFRESVVAKGNWQMVLHLNNLYSKLSCLAPDKKSIEILNSCHPFSDIDIDILNTLILFIKTRKKAKFIYKSPRQGLEELEFAPEYITFEEDKLYVWGHNLKYDNFGYLRIDKIKEITTQIYSAPKSDTDNFSKPVIVVEYLLKGYSAQMFECNEYEEVVQEDEDLIKVKAKVSNKFNFYQRILSFGRDCKLLSPESVKEEFLKILKDIKAGYENVSQ